MIEKIRIQQTICKIKLYIIYTSGSQSFYHSGPSKTSNKSRKPPKDKTIKRKLCMYGRMYKCIINKR